MRGADRSDGGKGHAGKGALRLHLQAHFDGMTLTVGRVLAAGGYSEIQTPKSKIPA
jgi:hypothetical protein